MTKIVFLYLIIKASTPSLWFYDKPKLDIVRYGTAYVTISDKLPTNLNRTTTEVGDTVWVNGLGACVIKQLCKDSI